MGPRPLALLLLLLLPLPARAEVPRSRQAWLDVDARAQLTPEWELRLAPGIRYRLSDGKGRLDEVRACPTWTRVLGDLTVQVGLWYDFNGHAARVDEAPYLVTHSLELAPSLAYRIGEATLSYRALFHTTLYANVYRGELRWGLGTVLRNLLQLRTQLTPRTALLLGTEPWLGLVENGGTAHHPAGYWEGGLRLNRVNVGFDLDLAPGFSLSPQYVLETDFDEEGDLAEVGHCVWLTASLTWSPSAPPRQDLAGDSVRANKEQGPYPLP